MGIPSGFDPGRSLQNSKCAGRSPARSEIPAHHHVWMCHNLGFLVHVRVAWEVILSGQKYQSLSKVCNSTEAFKDRFWLQ